MGDWSRGMILALGARGREFDSRITPLLFRSQQNSAYFGARMVGVPELELAAVRALLRPGKVSKAGN